MTYVDGFVHRCADREQESPILSMRATCVPYLSKSMARCGSLRIGVWKCQMARTHLSRWL